VKSLFGIVLMVVEPGFLSIGNWRDLLINLISNSLLEIIRNTSICNSELIADCVSCFTVHSFIDISVKLCTSENTYTPPEYQFSKSLSIFCIFY
jgi:hypothetical protein